jgi:hypothetical protein
MGAVAAPEPVTSDTAAACYPIAHLPRDDDPDRSLCGTALTGKLAPDWCDRCVVCRSLYEEGEQ